MLYSFIATVGVKRLTHNFSDIPITVELNCAACTDTWYNPAVMWTSGGVSGTGPVSSGRHRIVGKPIHH